jgi:hypothetical protein
MMKTTKILFTRESAIAYREGRKCRTQRVIRLPEWVDEYTDDAYLALAKKPSGFSVDLISVDTGRCYDIKKQYKCPYGQPGDRLQLLTSWAVPKEYDDRKPSDLLGSDLHCEDIWTYFDSDHKPECLGRLRSPLFMPGWLRNVMPHPKILSIEARRLREITDEECLEEGIEYVPREVGFNCYRWALKKPYEPNHKAAYRCMWDSINAKRGYQWDSNPWVLNIKFDKWNS